MQILSLFISMSVQMGNEMKRRPPQTAQWHNPIMTMCADSKHKLHYRKNTYVIGVSTARTRCSSGGPVQPVCFWLKLTVALVEARHAKI